MKNKWMLLCVLFAGITFKTGAQTITAASDPFSFPPITAIRAVKNTGHTNPYFTYSNMSSRLAGVRFAWSFPSQPQHQKGSIVIFSPMGRLLKTLPISTSEGAVTWGAVGELGMGVYIAKITCGATSLGLTFLMCR